MCRFSSMIFFDSVEMDAYRWWLSSTMSRYFQACVDSWQSTLFSYVQYKMIHVWVCCVRMRVNVMNVLCNYQLFLRILYAVVCINFFERIRLVCHVKYVNHTFTWELEICYQFCFERVRIIDWFNENCSSILSACKKYITD